MGRRDLHIGVWWEIQKERDHWEDLNIDRRIILRCILERQDWWYGLDSSG
jgi:hypothetical protein